MDIKKPHGKIEYKTLDAKVISLYKGRNSVSEVSPGASISIEISLDPSLTKADSLRGCVVSHKGKLPEIKYKIKLKINLLHEVFGLQEHKSVESIKTKELLMLNINTNTSVGSVEKVNKDKNEIELTLNIPATALKKDNVGIARNIEGHWRLIGFGKVL